MERFREFIESIKDLPHPPQGWKPEYMELNSETARKKAAAEFIKKGLSPREAMAISQEIAGYVYNYSKNPYNVYKRTLGQLSDDGVDYETALEKAKEAYARAKNT